MPPKSVICAICREIVTKKQSLDLSALGLGSGRACRKHEEVIEAVNSQRSAKANTANINDLQKKFRTAEYIDLLATMLFIECLIHGIVLVEDSILAHFTGDILTANEVQKAINLARALGADILSQTEIESLLKEGVLQYVAV